MDFTVGHNHPPKPGEARTIEILRKLKTEPHNGAKYSYRVRKELMKGICDGGNDEEQGLPTLLKRKKRGKKEAADPAPEETTVDPPMEITASDVTATEPYMEVNVDGNPLNISSTQVEDNTNIDAALQDIIQQLLSEPELLQSLVSSLSENERDMLSKLSSQGGTAENSENTPTNVVLEALPPPQLLATSALTSLPQFMVAGTSPQILRMSTSSSQFTTAGQNSIATEGQTSNTTTVNLSTQGGRIIKLPDNLLPHQLQIYNRLPSTEIRQASHTGPTIYFTPPEIKFPYCRQCTKTFTTDKELDHHFKSLQCCELCKIAFCVPKHFERHNELNHPDGLKSAWGSLCETCGRVFGVSFQLDSHRAKCSNRLSLRCPRCSFSFGFEEDLARHKLLHTSDVVPIYSFSQKKQ